MSPNSDAVEMEDRRLAYASSHSQEPIASTNLGSLISFHNINYEVMVKKQKKVILDNISGIFGPGMNAIMGPTGGGKSSCLDVLAGRKDPAGLSGYVLIDGQKQPPNFKSMCGYVLQDDIVMGTLTVKENLMFSAQVRLAEKVTVEQKNQRVIRVIKELGLQTCANTRVGTEFVRGISSSERKRCNIGIEMITLPPVLFLDEPTTGLDSNTASSVCKLLLKLAKRGRTIIFSIHQPRYSIFKLFDRLLLLARGEVMYHGDAQAAVHYLDSIGFSIEEMNNPPDFFLDVINGDTDQDRKRTPEDDDEENEKTENIAQSSEANKHLNKSQSTNEADQRFDRMAERFNVLLKAYNQSEYNQRVQKEIDPILNDYNARVASGTEQQLKAVDYSNGWGHQLKIVSGRAGLNIMRNPMTSVVQTVVMLIQAVVVGTIYFQIGGNPLNAIQDRVGVFFLILLGLVFGNLSSVELFIKERPIFIHENISGFYRVSVYFMAKVFSDFLPRRMVPVVVYSAITYWMIGLRVDAAAFFEFFLVLILVTIASSGVAFAASATFNVFAIANMLASMCFLLMNIFAGLLVNLNTMPVWLSWIKYLSIQHYAFNALSLIELKGAQFCANVTVEEELVYTCTNGSDYLTLNGMQFDSEWDLWRNMVALTGLGLGFMTLSYLQLFRMKKLK
ncbi:PREDICTED: ATP-binding cassette sub-family G member 2-like [Priapulus caudatus]|uniref:ATP-binding cassette sub-family G member 2-like n=1 Tax=Priapulus caudatus TaxID=37621 RepID=A0ABM1E4A0_PRICU|nr:PREDICTED: ATP-binding cassette sub-family G member 2-like [Priapulus caudatus]